MFIPPWEKIIEKKICRLSGEEFIVTDKDIDLLDKISPSFGGQKYSLPTPTLCPDERQKRRLSFRNERKMYKRKCDLSGKEIISVYSPDKTYPVYDQKVWWGDDWDPTTYGRAFDFERTFFGQFADLLAVTPKLSLYSVQCINSDYTNFALGSKDCYMSIWTTRSEEVLYSNFVRDVKNTIDSTFCYESELIYYGIDLTRCYNCFYAKNSVNCRDCFGVEECSDCHHCIGCYGLKNKEFHVFNKPVSKEVFNDVWKNAFLHGWSLKVFADLKSLRETQYVRNIHTINCENCYGDQIENGKNGFMCFDSKNIEDARYAYFSPKNNTCLDVTYTAPLGVEYCGECCSTLASNNFAVFQSAHESQVFYSMLCQNCDYVFWSASVKKWKHIILNTPYSVQEYETLCGKIIDHMKSAGEWGEFFPTELSTFGYNETAANEYFPMTEKEVKTKWWKWYDGENKNTYTGTHYTPLLITQYNEKIVWFDTATKNINECLNWIIQCEITGKPFKIIKQELLFYIQNGLPIPTKHPDQRHKERMDLRNPRTLHERICLECHKNIITTYAPGRPEKIVCEDCYRKLVY